MPAPPLESDPAMVTAIAVIALPVSPARHRPRQAARARRLLGPDAIIGLTVNSPARAGVAPLDLIDYAGVGGVYGTTSKTTKNTPIGPAGLKAVVEAFHRRKSGLPVCGIAGITIENAPAVIEAGADGVSVISALSMAKDPQAAARELLGVVDAALAKRGGR